MADHPDETGVFSVVCPCCEATVWIDGETRTVLRSEKAKKKKGSLDDFVAKEQKRQSEFDRKFEASFELQKEKHNKADELFQKALEKAEQGGDDDDGGGRD